MEQAPGRKAGPSSPPDAPGLLGTSDLTRRSFFAHAAAVTGTAALSGLSAAPAMAASGRKVETVVSPKVIPNVRVAITLSYGTVRHSPDESGSMLRNLRSLTGCW